MDAHSIIRTNLWIAGILGTVLVVFLTYAFLTGPKPVGYKDNPNLECTHIFHEDTIETTCCEDGECTTITGPL